MKSLIARWVSRLETLARSIETRTLDAIVGDFAAVERRLLAHAEELRNKANADYAVAKTLTERAVARGEDALKASRIAGQIKALVS